MSVHSLFPHVLQGRDPRDSGAFSLGPVLYGTRSKRSGLGPLGPRMQRMAPRSTNSGGAVAVAKSPRNGDLNGTSWDTLT